LGFSERIFDVVSDILLEVENQSNFVASREFHDLVSALTIDTGISRKDVEFILLDTLAKNPRFRAPDCGTV
jgi:hypothetical protein